MLNNNKKQPSPERLFLLDGMALAYRAYFTFINRPLINSKGENTSAIYGFVNTLIKILEEEKPEHIAVAFDTREPTFRHKLYKEYKATREKMPEDMSAQMDKLKETVQAFNVPLLELPGFEADDIMGTLAKKAERIGIDTFLVTGDKDFMQLISPHVKMYKPGKQGDDWEIIDENSVKEKFGVPPELVIDVLGLTGDKSDNVPGIRGIGEKTAIPLVQEFGTIENILKNLDKVSPKGLQQKIQEQKESALFSKRLVTIDTDVPINADIHHLEAKPRNNEHLIKLFTEFEFRSLVRKFSNEVNQKESAVEFDVIKLELNDISTDKHDYKIVRTRDELNALIKKLERAKLFVFDTETTSTDPLSAELVGLSFAFESKNAWYIPINPELKNSDKENFIEHNTKHQNELFDNQAHTKHEVQNTKSTAQAESGFPLDLISHSMSSIFSDSSIKKIGQNIKYDVLVLAKHGIQVKGIVFDTMVANYILHPESQHNLDALAEKYLSYKMISYNELTGSGKEKKELREIPVELVGEYSAQDADITFRLFDNLKTKLEQGNLLDLAENVEFPLIPVLADIELTGVKLDTEYLSELSKELEIILGNLVTKIYNLAGETFNANSTQQLGKILFEKLKLSTGKKTKTGFSTDVAVLESLRRDHPIIEELLEYRQLQKLKSTYVDALPSLINPATQRLHTSFNQTIAATGRLSSSNPNLQNIPIRTEIGSRIRKAFIPSSSDMLILSADYSQIELRIMAHISGDESMTAAFQNDEDIHTTTATKIFGLLPVEITKEMRRKAKEVNFGIMYGIGPYGLANRLDISQSEAKEIITKYFERFPKVHQYILDTISKAKRDGFVSTLLGRRRFLPDINSRNANIRSGIERQAINMPIQGTAAEMIKIAMINIHNKIQNLRSKMILQVHDELVFEIATSEERKIKKIIMDEMKNALVLTVPIKIDIGIGKNWLEAH
jgi:DNA polymerase I